MSRRQIHATTELNMVVALRHLGVERELLVLKVKADNYYAFMPRGRAGISEIENHFSYHRSGRRHMVAKRFHGGEWIEDKWPGLRDGPQRTMRQHTDIDLEPIPIFHGSTAFAGCNILPKQFVRLESVGTNSGDLLILDTGSRNFRDDFTAVRLHIVEPGCEDTIAVSDYVGPRILHLIKEPTPWVAVEVFQQKA